MKTILIAILSVAAVYGAAVAVNDTAKAGTIVPSLRVEADPTPVQVEAVDTMLTVSKRTAHHSATARSQASAERSKRYACVTTGLASDISATVRRCEWL
jgi:hypothetical protein